MSEENTQVKISMPLIDDIELHRIDNFYNDIVSEYTKAFVKEKEQVIIQRLMMNLQQENKQLKGVIKTKYDDLESKDKEIIELRNERDRLNKLLNIPAYRNAYIIEHQRDKYKEVIEEVREILTTTKIDGAYTLEDAFVSVQKAVQILDKAKENK